MKTPPPEDPKPARRQKPVPGSDLRKVVPLSCALAAGCTGPQVRPEPFTCPEGAVATRRQLRWDESQHFIVVADDRYDPYADVWLRAGDTVVGVVPDNISSAQREVAPPGTRFFGGKVYVVPGETKTGKPGQVFVRYDRVKLPRQDELPVCFIINLGADEVKDGAGKILNITTGLPLDYWP